MKELVIFYSFSGNTGELARELSAKQGADLVEVKDARKPGKVGAFLRIPAAIGMKKTPVQPIKADMGAYEKITVMAPVWAGHPAPAINNVFDMLPGGKSVAVVLVSQSGKSDCREKIEAKVQARGCTLESFEDIKK